MLSEFPQTISSIPGFNFPVFIPQLQLCLSGVLVPSQNHRSASVISLQDNQSQLYQSSLHRRGALVPKSSLQPFTELTPESPCFWEAAFLYRAAFQLLSPNQRWGWGSFWPKCRSSHFLCLNAMFSFSHSSSLSTSLWTVTHPSNLPTALHNFVSSPNLLRLHTIPCWKKQNQTRNSHCYSVKSTALLYQEARWTLSFLDGGTYINTLNHNLY